MNKKKNKISNIQEGYQLSIFDILGEEKEEIKMAKFNTTNTVKTVNKCGYPAFQMKDKEKLTHMVLTSFFGEAKYYGDNTIELVELAKQCAVTDPRYLANLTIYARKEMNLRSVSHALTAIIANVEQSKKYAKQLIYDVCLRADDMLEILACYINMFGKPIPNSMKKGLGLAFGKFNDYDFSKYNGGNRSVKFKDILRLVHVNPKSDEQSKLFNQIINDTLPIAVRWETELSENGNNKETWTKLINDGNVGYMAMLRNMRNIINADLDGDVMDKVYDLLSNKEAVLKSKQLPFRFYSAYREIYKNPRLTNKTLKTLSKAMQHSVENLTKMKGKTLIALDVSGSMGYRVSNKSTVQCCEVAAVLTSLANHLCDESIIYTFDTSVKKYLLDNEANVIDNVMKLRFNGGGTDINVVLRKMLQDKVKVDRIIILSDNENNRVFKNGNSLLDKYKEEINKDIWLHAVDLMGYGTQHFYGNKVNYIAGWSEKMLDLISMVEEGTSNQTKVINEYKYID